MKTMLALTTACLVMASALCGQPSDKLTFKADGFSIAPLAEGQNGTTMFLPATDGFAPNVNIQIQAYEDGIDAYATLSRQQFKDLGMKMSSERKVGKTTVVFEYSGQFNETTLHWYARAVKNGASVYVVTATATESQWSSAGPKLKACVDSFELLNLQENPSLQGTYIWKGNLPADMPIRKLAGTPISMTLDFKRDGTFTQTTALGDDLSPGKYVIDGAKITITFDNLNEAPGYKRVRQLTRSGDALLDEDNKRWEKQ